MNRVTSAILSDLKALENKTRAAFLMGFFKTGQGQYAEGDKFMGLSVPAQRKVALTYAQAATLEDIDQLLKNELHEVRQTSLMILGWMFEKANDDLKRQIYTFYLNHTQFINNWDMVDGSAPTIVGQFILTHPQEKKRLLTLIKSTNMWERRIAMVATYAFIKAKELEIVFQLAEKLLIDKQDLIHKAMGWMLREAGKVDRVALERFLDKYASTMPRTALRYSLEKFDSDTKTHYMRLKSK
jgi:3-methyladenine DNA glycosylase AlkD